MADFNDMGGVMHIDYSNIQDGIDSIRVDPLSLLDWGDHNISGDPLFSGSGDDEFALSDGSPCIDNGTPDTSDLNILFYDLINNYRIWDGDGNGSEIIDMGAYEFDAPVWVGIPVFEQKPDDNFISTIYPNPSSGSIHIRYNTLERSSCECIIYSSSGEIVKNIRKESFRGENEMRIDLSGLPVGTYFISLICGAERATEKVMISN